MVLLDPGGADETLVMLQATSKATKGAETTVEFTSHLCGHTNGTQCAAGQIYTVTTPHHSTGAPELVGRAVHEMNRFFPLAVDADALADALERQGRTADARKVREGAQRLKEMAEQGK